MNPILSVALFIAFLLLAEIVFRLIRGWKNPGRVVVEKRLQQLTAKKYEYENVDLVMTTKYGGIPALDALFTKFSASERLVRFLEQANVRWSLGQFLLMTIVGMIVGLFLMKFNLLLGLLFLLLLGGMPTVYIHLKKKERMAKFEKQLPDSMDLIARSLRAGLAFSAGLKLVSDEFGDPVGTEFGKTVSEINFGIPTDEALKDLALRVDCLDLRFFVISIILQKETGGNLAEILESSARLIRERFKFIGKVKALTAEGRMSTWVLVGLPIFLSAVFYIINPAYIMTLKDEPAGVVMVVWSVIMMIIGVTILRKMVQLKT